MLLNTYKNFFLSTKIKFDEKSNVCTGRELKKDIHSQRVNNHNNLYSK